MDVACLSDAARVGNRLWAIREPSPSAESQGVVMFHAASRGAVAAARSAFEFRRGRAKFSILPADIFRALLRAMGVPVVLLKGVRGGF